MTQVTVSWRAGRAGFPPPDPRKVKRLTLAAAEAAGVGETDFVSVSFLDSAAMEKMNGQCLGHAGDTDVISFDYRAGDDPDSVVELIICPAAAAREAAKRELPYARELTLYLVHGLLHIAGFDDLKPELKRRMRRAERRVLAVLEKRFRFESIFPAPRDHRP